jgi:hypothetical protein
MEKKLTNNGPLKELADKHSIYIHPTLMDATAKQRSSSMHGTSWLQSSVLAVGLDVAPAAPVG